ncbi:hypothetical protein D3C72_2164200 [compost metagenome]
MIKKLMIASAFAGSMLVTVPAAASGSPAMCFFAYDIATANCGEDTRCAQNATIALNNCLQALQEIKD